MKKHLFSLISLVILTLVLSGCTNNATASSWPGISYQDGVAYVAYGPSVYAMKTEDHTLVWQYPEKANNAITYYATPAVTSDGQIIVCDYKGSIVALNQATGQSNWTYTTADRVIADPLIVGDTIYVSSSDYTIYALTNSGSLIWKYTTENSLWAKPVYADGKIYQAGMDHKLYVLSANDGELLSTTDLGSPSLGSPVVDASGTVYASTLGKEIVAIEPKNHTILWRYQASDSIWSGLAEKDGILYFGDLSGNFVALDSATHKPVRQYQAGGAIVSTPLLLDDKILITSEDGLLTALDYQGNVLFSQTLSKNLYAPVVPAGDKILVGVSNDSEKVFTALNSNGTVTWNFKP